MTDLLRSNKQTAAGDVECLGHTFQSDQVRREYFLNLLAEKLKDPAFRQQEGFPQGTDEAILAMSDPPYYTACPNPWLADFVAHHGKPYDSAETYRREPMAVDVSVGKSDPVYKAHSYHTKVPHLAIVPSILHYTKPGDIILDGFAGSGMTGVAAQWCAVAPAQYRAAVESEWKSSGLASPEWGARPTILADISPVATFIADNYNHSLDIERFLSEAHRIFAELEEEYGWMYAVKDGARTGKIDFTVWSEIFHCPECAGEIVFHDHALDNSGRVKDTIVCPSCSADLGKSQLDLAFETIFDPATKTQTQRPKRKPVLIRYTQSKKKQERLPNAEDLQVINQVEALPFPTNAPLSEFPDMQMTRVGRMRTTKIKHIHDLFLPRSLHVLSGFFSKVNEIKNADIRKALAIIAQHQFVNASILNRYRPASSFGNSPLTGVFYVSSLVAEANVIDLLRGSINRIKRMEKTAWGKGRNWGKSVFVTTASASQLNGIDDCVIDYIFTDPPFGENIYYSDLNFLTESWHRVTTDPTLEAIVDRVKSKGVLEYQKLVQSCFAEYYRVLKPGRWITVVFSNSRAAVWNAIQVAMQQVGFVVAEVSTLDKVHLTFQQAMSPNAVKQDLVISAYKPNGGLEERLSKRGAAPESAWDFVQTHLRQLPVSKSRNGILEVVVERDPRRIYDRMIAWFVRHDFPVPLSTEDFLEGLRSRYPERDGMMFLPEQVAEYDRKRAQAAQAPQIELFVSDERSAIDWLTDFLRRRPSTYQEIHPEFTVQLGAGWRKHEEKPELLALLEDCFLRYDGKSDVPSQIHSYLSTNFKDLRGLEKDDLRLKAKAKDRWYVPDPSKAKDLEQKRERSLLKEFEGYKTATGRRLKEFRLEVLRAGFKTSWAARDYRTIIGIAQKIPEEALQEDEKLLLWYDQALTRTEADA
ncbi:site-specific DNA-methyltransferase [Mesorhizobium sp. BR115XR7A]|uniref:DNA methyltransferase n=1 Tax=Mesorhizobium sp. BR115XR7A TaxID=2876645 RepID=UPI001CCE70FB|nr:DNA methyltransferase [Mesorhizobium sp. BR115XR7A]MBZ9908077.1 site-specific DNA-methyltransferase [Mesorhizobium sp. BR115XR7A]MBZ9931379.1 site-specific DNA-methyltransferase [Mesorhizobium sp. BR1-1-5]